MRAVGRPVGGQHSGKSMKDLRLCPGKASRREVVNSLGGGDAGTNGLSENTSRKTCQSGAGRTGDQAHGAPRRKRVFPYLGQGIR